MRKINLTQYRPRAVDAARHLIVTGNALIRRVEGNRRVVYGIRDHCVRRNVQGDLIECLLRDAKQFGALPEGIRSFALAQKPGLKPDDTVTLWSHYKFDGSRWAFRQAVDEVLIDNGVKFRPVDLPVLSLVWSLPRGENYGRGLVEDHASAFHQIDVLTRAVIDMIGVMADIKFLVDPASMLDVVELNASPRGSYHQGRKDDITTPENSRRLEIGVTREYIAALERELAQGFLLNSSGVRDAERVTAEEIRFIARELESAFGGLYSRLALEWQKQEAEFAVSQIDFKTDLPGKVKAFEIVVTTGLESLSREGQLDNLRRAIADLQMLEAVPDEFRQTINPEKFASFIFTNHAVKYREFMLSAQEIQANQQAALQQEQQLMQAQAAANVEEEAGKQAVTGS